MDELKLKLRTNFMRGFVSNIISKVVFNKTGIDPNVQINDVNIESEDDKIKIHINIDAEIGQKELLKVTRLLNLDKQEGLYVILRYFTTKRYFRK